MSTVHVAPSAPAQPPAPVEVDESDRGFRSDIQGLRAISVVLVILYHLKVTGFSGGFVGVDVFLVISGFLITGQLLRVAQRPPHRVLADFYQRRARRLLPSAAAVVLCTTVASRIWAPPLQTRSTGIDAVYTVFYGLNYRLAADGIDYQRSGSTPSPLQHFWSLAVEEQFYLLWPIVVLATVALFRRHWPLSLRIILLLTTVASFLVSRHLTVSDAPLAYFSLQSRAWELGVGAVLQVFVAAARQLPSRVANLAAGTGTVLIVLAALTYDDSTPFPGQAALLPVGGAALVILSGLRHPTWLERALLSRSPVRHLGALSYALYLWHWPLIVLAPTVVGHALSWPEKLVVALVAVVLSQLTQLLIEQPTRRASVSGRDWLVGAALISLTTVTVAILLVSNAVSVLTVPPVAAAPTAAGHGRDPLAGTRTGGQVTPTVLHAVRDTPAYPSECIVDIRGSASPRCLIGPDGRLSARPVTSDRIVLLGDSHAGQIFDPLLAIAADQGWSVEVLTKVGCPIADVDIYSAALRRAYNECGDWRRAAVRRLATEPPPRMFVIGQLNRYDIAGDALRRGWAKTLSELAVVARPIVYLRDTPVPSADVPTCVSGALDDWRHCDFPSSPALLPDALALGPPRGVSVLDVNSYLCPRAAARCPAVRAGILLYRDDSHVSRTAMLALTPIMRQELVNADLIPGRKKVLPPAG